MQLGLNKKTLNSIAVSLLLSVEILSYALSALGILTFYRIMYPVTLIAVVLVVAGAFIGRKIDIKRLRLGCIYYIFLLFVYLLSLVVVPEISYEPISFIYCFTFSVIIISVQFDVEIVVTFLTVISVIIVPAYSNLFQYEWQDISQANMGAMYAVLVMVTAALCHFIYFRKNRKKIFYIFYIPPIIGFVGLLQFANRGVILSLAVLVILILFNREKSIQKSNEINGKVGLWKKRIWLGILAVAGLIVAANFTQIFLFFYNVLNSFLGEMPSFFVKMYKMITVLSDISNGRSDVYAAALAGIADAPLTGHGIASFTYYTGYAYEHNFILQLLYEGGILFCIIPLVVVLFVLYKLLFAQIKDRNILVFTIILTVQVIPRFLFSASIWEHRFFWILIFYVFANYSKFRSGDAKKLRFIRSEKL